MKGYLVVSILIAFVMALFSVQNAQTIRVSFLSWYIESPLAVILLISFAAGSLTAFCVSIPTRIRLAREIRALKDAPPHPPREKHDETTPPRG